MSEAWLSGPVAGVDAYLMPAVHGLMQAKHEIETAVALLDDARLWRKPGVAAPPGYHLDHLAGSIDRLLTYARGEMLSGEQLAALAAEGKPGEPPRPMRELAGQAEAAIERALSVIRNTSRDTLLEPRVVGRRQLPTNVLGLLFHIAEHTQRHTGQLISTARALSQPR